MKTNKLFLIAALLGTALVGCQKVAEIQTPEEKPEVDKPWTLTVQAVKGEDTRAMEFANNGGTLNAYWKKGEKVSVFAGGILGGTLEVISETKANPATLSGQISVENVSEGSTLVLIFPGREDGLWTYLNQDGTAPSEAGTMATGFDYATTSFTVTEIDTDNNVIEVDTESVTFGNQQSVYRLGFKVSDAYINPKSFILSSAGNTLVRSREFSNEDWRSVFGPVTLTPTAVPTDNFYYMSVRNETTAADVMTFTVVGADNALYEGTKSVPATAQGLGKFLGMKNIALTKKTFSPATGTISAEADVL